MKGIIFDFDGTLFDSMSIWETAGEDYLRSIGLTAEASLSKRLKSMSLLQAAEYLKARYDLPMTVEAIMDGVNRTVEAFYFDRAMPKEGVKAFLEKIQEKGIRMCIATATDRYQVKAALSRCGMLHFFEEIFTCTQVGHGKDEPQIFDCARAFLDMEKSEIAVFEDAYHAAKTAKDAGYFVVGVYDPYEMRTEELKALADRYVDGFAQALSLLDGQY